MTITAAVWARSDGADWRTCIFLVLGLAQLGVALAVRAHGAGRRNPFLIGAVATAVVLQVCGVLVPGLRTLLETSPLPPEMWLRCLLLATIPGLVTWLVRASR